MLWGGRRVSPLGLARAWDVPGPRAEGANECTATTALQYTGDRTRTAVRSFAALGKDRVKATLPG